jgi:hypothetical protein
MVDRFRNVIVHLYRRTPISVDKATNEAQNLCFPNAFIVYFLHVPASWSVIMETTLDTIGRKARTYIVLNDPTRKRGYLKEFDLEVKCGYMGASACFRTFTVTLSR